MVASYPAHRTLLVSSIFVCYRRDDASGHAGRLHDRLVPAFGRDKIFMDIDALAPGVDFDEEIRRTLSGIDVMLVIIGKRWVDARDDAGNRRLDNPDDYVRLEIAAALSKGIRVIPVTVGDAKPPKGTDLPDDIRTLARRHAVELTDKRWDYDTEQLLKAIRKITPAAPAVPKRSSLQATAPAARATWEPPPRQLVGSWVQDIRLGLISRRRYVFREDGTFESVISMKSGRPGPTVTGRYFVKESKLVLLYSSGKEFQMTCQFSEGRLILDKNEFDRVEGR